MVKLFDDDVEFLKAHAGKHKAVQMLVSSGFEVQQIKDGHINKQMSLNYNAILAKYPLFKKWPQVLKRVLKVIK